MTWRLGRRLASEAATSVCFFALSAESTLGLYAITPSTTVAANAAKATFAAGVRQDQFGSGGVSGFGTGPVAGVGPLGEGVPPVGSGAGALPAVESGPAGEGFTLEGSAVVDGSTPGSGATGGSPAEEEVGAEGGEAAGSPVPLLPLPG